MNYQAILVAIIITLIVMLVVSSPTMTLLLFLFLVAFYWAVSRAIEYLNEQIVAQFAALNHQLNITLNVPPRKTFNLEWAFPSLKGHYLGRQIDIVTLPTNIGGVSVPHTTITLDALHYGNTFEIKSENWITFIKKFWGKQDILTGDKHFDSRFYITSNNANFMRQLLDADIRDIMNREAFLQMGKFTLKESQLKYEEQVVINTDNDRERIEKIILIMYMMVKRMEYMRAKKGIFG